MFARLLMLLLVVALAGPDSALAQHPRTAFDPNDPEKTRPVVSRAERERLGLAAKTWEGVVQPEVYTVLDRLNNILEEARKADTVEAIDTLDRVQFHGTVYVQVRLRHDPEGKADSKENQAALRDVQRRVLGSLTAAEFHVRQIFEQSVGLVGHASEEGLDKLAKHPDLAAVCLDDQPLPEAPPKVYRSQFADPKAGEFDDEPGVKAKKVDVKVYQALKQSERVFVLLSLEPTGEPLPTSTHVRSEMHQRALERDAAVRKLQDRVLSAVTADDFWLWTRLGGLPGLGGYVNREGLEKLSKHPEVSKIGLEGLKKHGWRKPSSPGSRRDR